MKEIIGLAPVSPYKSSPTTEFLQTTEIILRGFNKDFYFLPNDEWYNKYGNKLPQYSLANTY